jgi:hypothetical protein
MDLGDGRGVQTLPGNDAFKLRGTSSCVILLLVDCLICDTGAKGNNNCDCGSGKDVAECPCGSGTKQASVKGPAVTFV